VNVEDEYLSIMAFKVSTFKFNSVLTPKVANILLYRLRNGVPGVVIDILNGGLKIFE
jgi:hypothetical protein